MFVPGRWIAENSILAREIMHMMRRKTHRGGLLGIKMDMHKAYDMMEWSLVLKCFRFNGILFF